MTTLPEPKSFQPGGAVNPARRVYIERDTDHTLLELMRQGHHANLHAGRQAGKTTLMMNVSDVLSREGHWCIEEDLSVHFVTGTLRDGLLSLIDAVYEQLSVLSGARCEMPAPTAKDGIRHIVERFLCRLVEVMPAQQCLYLLLDELDILMRYPVAEVGEFFIALRSFMQRHNAHDHRLTLLLVSVLTPTEMMLEHNTGGISINFLRDVPLKPFENTPAIRGQLRTQAFAGYDAEQAEQVLSQLLELTGGQPFLVAVVGQELQKAADLAAGFAALRQDLLTAPRSIAYGHFQAMRKQIIDMGSRVYRILQTYLAILRGERVSVSTGGWDATSLESIALIKLDADHRYQVANPLYRQRFDAAWVNELLNELETTSLAKRFDTKAGRKRLALIMCGGTVGMTTQQGHTGFQGASDVLMEFIQNELAAVAEIEPVILCQLDGINMTPIQWGLVADAIYRRWDAFDGFVVAQGTDTLAYTACAVAFMLGRVDKPVVFTGAQTTVDVPYGDARDNLFRSCFVAAHDDAAPEVQVCFGDLVLRAVRAEKKDDRLFEGFHSPAWPHLARVTERLLPNKTAWLHRKKTARKLKYAPELATRLLYIPLVPGLLPEYFLMVIEQSFVQDKPLEGIIITTPGLGNIPSIEPYNFRPFIQQAVARGIPVLISSQMPINPYTQDQYEAASVPTQYGAIPAGNLTPGAAFAKFSWIIGQINKQLDGKRYSRIARLEKIKRGMRKNYIGEEGDFG